jgi:uncharacterized membrane protein
VTGDDAGAPGAVLATRWLIRGVVALCLGWTLAMHLAAPRATISHVMAAWSAECRYFAPAVSGAAMFLLWHWFVQR